MVGPESAPSTAAWLPVQMCQSTTAWRRTSNAMSTQRRPKCAFQNPLGWDLRQMRAQPRMTKASWMSARRS